MACSVDQSEEQPDLDQNIKQDELLLKTKHSYLNQTFKTLPKFTHLCFSNPLAHDPYSQYPCSEQRARWTKVLLSQY